MATAPFTLPQLAAEVSRLLGDRGLLAAQRDGRVSAAPDPRTVRYYTTLGLLDPPAIRDRQARYDHRHVLQLAAIKALQAAGLGLGAIQERLYGLADRELEALLVAAAPKRRRVAVAALTWREVVLEPGLKLMAEASWKPAASREALAERLHAALDALEETPPEAAEGE
jgi:DNA-binding transcriptional MerR regulator